MHVQVKAVQRKRLTSNIKRNSTPRAIASHKIQGGQKRPVQVESESVVYKVSGANFSPGSRTVTVVEAKASVSFEFINGAGDRGVEK